MADIKFKRIDLPDAEVYYCEEFLSDHESWYTRIDECIRSRTELPPPAQLDPDREPTRIEGEGSWLIMPVKVWGKVYNQPRLTCYMGDPHLPYHYSGYDRYPIEWRADIDELRTRLEEAIRQLNPTHPRLSSVLCNKYRDGTEYIGPHSDDEADLSRSAYIVSVSLGSERDFILQSKKDKTNRTCITLKSGSVILMGPGTQEHYKHSVPVRKRVKKPRINLTYRSIQKR